MKKNNSITQEQFTYIVEQSDALLKEHASKFSFAGNAWLNVLHSHPSIRTRYVHVFHKRTFTGWIVTIAKGAGVLLADLFLSFLSFFQSKPAYKNIPAHTDVLFISHLLNKNTAADAPDFYFQELPAYLGDKGYFSSIGLIDHVSGFAGQGSRLISSSGNSYKFILPRRLGFSTEWKLLWMSLQTAAFFFKQHRKEKDPLKRSFLLELTGNTLSAHSLRGYRLFEVAKYIFANTQCKAVALTWEGHSWEKMVCHAAKTADRKVVSIGYQHTILFPSSHALKTSAGAAFDPDIILTVGSVTREILAASADLKKVKIIPYGSPRLKGNEVYDTSRDIKNACLVAPEGLVNECVLLFSFAIETAKLLPGTQFIFRTHPSVSFAELQEEDERLKELPLNVIISTEKDINNDFKKCSWVLYRNSSVSFFGLMHGLRPVYLMVEKEISNDVLYTLKDWRKSVQTPAQLIDIIRQDKNTPHEKLLEERTDAQRFSREYMMPYDMTVFENIIKAV